MAVIQGKTGEWEMVIGLEVHAQVISHSKLFSGASTAFGAEPNSQVSLVDAAMPGMLPVLNKVAVEQAVRTGLGLNAQINLTSVFERKNYFYADLPQGYQISQYLHPIVGEGTIVLDLEDGETREVGIERLHLEQDAGKSIHDQHPTQSYIDLNRSGVTLMEIVSKPDMRSAEEAGAYLRKLRTILRYLGTCDGNMDEGSMRADVNLSMRRPGEPFGTRTETKNVNSIRFVQQAIEMEARRQVEVLEEGGEIRQETRLFDGMTGKSRSMRSKEEAHDYRYFPDPDLLPLELDAAWVEEIKGGLPELPDAKKARFIETLGLSAYDAGVLVADRDTAAFFETVAEARDAKLAANWVIGDYFGALNKSGANLDTAPIDGAKLGGLLDLIADSTISGRIAKEVFEEMWESGQDAGAIVEAKGMKQISDSSEIESLVEDIIANNPKQVEQFKGGNEKILGWFVGQVMKATQGKANPGMVNQVLRSKLG
ncbi:Asp-tRNA(Asn)/Glu-tRNA(Gln) amidotransferase subunit GatB [Pelagibius litoralis]|uniref:Aspartyl/glutamyl-tRNA(Asn/Gln) amidotransferase subunit B n=1 Tax=Pelagibius litoralis TaxID=374515 RepID=A0A967EZH0_9PROT|nr:Asp-tRNA(Asn)/Glu-tRNA(Gln) amidotransferase subunit GatB [Pelagibius litoralis]NIA70247.1 Asp-tRNA(Asn)/Glu-tRNA(Gln) amidotransferase subunit GatB [Pelagibius litoralis]